MSRRRAPACSRPSRAPRTPAPVAPPEAVAEISIHSRAGDVGVSLLLAAGDESRTSAALITIGDSPSEGNQFEIAPADLPNFLVALDAAVMRARSVGAL